jgi:dTDP-glucose 4,6-dehydratase
MKKSALIAGGSGFVGSHICDLLQEKGYDVVVVDNLVTGREANLKEALGRGAKFVQANINDSEDLLQKLETTGVSKFDEIYNMASPASPIDFAKMPIFILETASRGHRNLLDLAKRHQARILFASSSEVYGDAEVHPQPETYFGNVNTVGHRGCYDEAKRYGEALTVAYAKEFAVETRIARIFNTYGPRMRPNDGRIIPNFFVQALQNQSLTIYGDGSQTRSFCFVKDEAKGLVALMHSAESRPVNVGNSVERSVLEVASMVNKLTGNLAPVRHLPLPENDPKLRRPDTTRLEKSTGWKPETSLEDGLKSCFSYFKAELATSGKITAPTLENMNDSKRT